MLSVSVLLVRIGWVLIDILINDSFLKCFIIPWKIFCRLCLMGVNCSVSLPWSLFLSISWLFFLLWRFALRIHVMTRPWPAETRLSFSSFKRSHRSSGPDYCVLLWSFASIWTSSMPGGTEHHTQAGSAPRIPKTQDCYLHQIPN